MVKILFINSSDKNCGIYDFGVSIFDAIQKSIKYKLIYKECSNWADLKKAENEIMPDIFLFNYSPKWMPWLIKKYKIPSLRQNKLKKLNGIKIGIIHEITQSISNNASSSKFKFVFLKYEQLINSIFDYYIAPDPALQINNKLVFKTGRLIPNYANNFSIPEFPTIGSFGLATPDKGFLDIITNVEATYNNATIRFHLNKASAFNNNEEYLNELITKCHKQVTKPGINLIITTGYKSKTELLDYLAQNTINIFLYKSGNDRGISSVPDYALAVGRPIAISKSTMFRHLQNIKPSIYLKDSSITEIINNGISPIEHLKEEWSEKHLIEEYENVFCKVLNSDKLTN